MAKNHLRIGLFILLCGSLISGCAQLGLQSREETPEPTSIPDCKKNYTREGSFISGRVYKTWVNYENLDYKKGFDTAVTTFRAQGHRVIYTDRDSGTIDGEMTFESHDAKSHPVEIKFVKEKTSLTLHLSSKSNVGSTGQETFCSFYEEFEKGVKRVASLPPPKRVPPPPRKPPETEIGSVPPAPPPPPATQKPVPSSPPPSPSPTQTPLAQAEVTWSVVNLREGPGTNYRIIRKLNRGTPLAILDEKKGWLQIQLDEGVEGWLSKSATSTAVKRPPPPPPTPSPAPSPLPPSPKGPASSKPKSPM